MDIAPILLFLFWLSVFTQGFIQSFLIVRRIHKYEGRVTAKIIGIRNDDYYFKFVKTNNFYPTYQYSIDDILYEIESPWGYREYNCSVGQEVILFYDLKRPKKFVPGEEEKEWEKSTLEKGIGAAIFWAIAIYAFFIE